MRQQSVGNEDFPLKNREMSKVVLHLELSLDRLLPLGQAWHLSGAAPARRGILPRRRVKKYPGAAPVYRVLQVTRTGDW